MYILLHDVCDLRQVPNAIIGTDAQCSSAVPTAIAPSTPQCLAAVECFVPVGMQLVNILTDL